METGQKLLQEGRAEQQESKTRLDEVLERIFWQVNKYRMKWQRRRESVL